MSYSPALYNGQASAANSKAITLSNENVNDLNITGDANQTALVNNILTVPSGAAATDATGYRSGTVQMITTGNTGSLFLEGSNDNVNFILINSFRQDQVSGTPVIIFPSAIGGNSVYVFPIVFRYIRVRINVVCSGTGVQAFARLSQMPYARGVDQNAQTTAANLASTMTIASGTVTTATTLANGQTAHSSASIGSPVRGSGRVNTNLDTTLVQNDACDLFMTTAGQLVKKPYGSAESDWLATSGTTPLATTTSTALKTAGAATIRNYATGVQLYNSSATVSTTVSILDGASVLWTGFVPAQTIALVQPRNNITFPVPLRGSTATAMNIQCGTTGAAVYYNVQGYQSF